MPKITEEPVQRIHVLLFASDVEFLKEKYGESPGLAPAVRAIVRKFTKNARVALERLEEKQPAEPSA